MIDNITTKNNYGYTYEELAKCSNKPVALICDYCGAKIITKKNSVQKKTATVIKHACKKCGPLKLREVMLLKYGVDNPRKVPAFETKRTNTVIERFGATHHFLNKDIQAKRKAGWIEKYGVDNPFKNAGVIAKGIATNMERYGVPIAMQCKEIQDKVVATNMERYGVKCTLEEPETYKKAKATMKERYGFEHALQSEELMAKSKATSVERFGVDNCWKSKAIRDKINATMFDRYGTMAPNQLCGKTEDEIKTWLKSLGFDFVPNRKILDQKEIDFYNEELALGIEYCGLYWHTEDSPQPRTSTYHLNKYKKCKEKGVRLITMFEDEWKSKQLQCKNFLQHIINPSNNEIQAKDCRILTIDAVMANKFIEDNHILGSTTSGIYFAGITYKDELIGVMSFGKNEKSLILDSFCFRPEITVVDGVKQLFQYLVELSGANEIIAWSDNRWNQNETYEQLGFILDKEVLPDYNFVDITHHHRLNKSDCPKDMTEIVWVKQKSLSRIWDCGQTQWKWSN